MASVGGFGDVLGSSKALADIGEIALRMVSAPADPDALVALSTIEQHQELLSGQRLEIEKLPRKRDDFEGL